MSVATRRRLLIAVSPRLLGDTLARTLATGGGFEVVHYSPEDIDNPSMTGTTFDVGVVTGDLPAGVSVGVLVRLPETPTGAGIGRIRTSLGERDVLIEDIAAIRRMMSEVGPTVADAAC